MEDSEVWSNIQGIISLHDQTERYGELLSHLKTARNLCARDAITQETIAKHDELHDILKNILFAEHFSQSPLSKMAWQLVANSIVQNATAQHITWTRHGSTLVNHYANQDMPLSENTNIQLMIVHTMTLGGAVPNVEQQALRMATRVWQAILSQKCESDFDFLHIVFEQFIVHNGRRTVACYARLDPVERIAFLDYLTRYQQHDCPNGAIHSFLLQYISSEFKKKSDCIMRQNASTEDVQRLQPREAYGLLRVLASATGSETYSSVFANDHALFLNVSSLLRCLAEAGKAAQQNTFTPMNKLEEVARASHLPHDYETEISYELKTLLVRCVANLLYKNKTNQTYCLDTQLLPTLLECTNMDARNPLIKEWSIMAIRNACSDCPEVQNVIAGLVKKGTAPNDMLDELDLKLGAMRIKPNQ